MGLILKNCCEANVTSEILLYGGINAGFMFESVYSLNDHCMNFAFKIFSVDRFCLSFPTFICIVSHLEVTYQHCIKANHHQPPNMGDLFQLQGLYLFI